MQYQGNTLRWSDISKYMKELGKKLLFKNFADTDDVENFYSQIYSEIKCVSYRLLGNYRSLDFSRGNLRSF